MDTFEKAAGRNEPGHYLEEEQCSQREGMLVVMVEHSGPSEGRNGEARKRVRGEKVREGAKCWVMKDLASHDMDLDGILSVMGRQKSAVSVWRVTVEADTH